MKTIDEELIYSGKTIQTAFRQIPAPDGSAIKRRHARHRAGSAGLAAAMLVAGFALVSSLTGANGNSSGLGSASGTTSDLQAYGLDLGAPWIQGEIYHNDGAYDVDYWESYYYLPMSDGEASSVVVRITTRAFEDEEAARRSSPGLGGRDAIETQVGGRDVGVLIDNGTYSYGWIDGNALVDLMVIQMAPDAVTRELAETVLSNVRILTVAERSAFEGSQSSIPSGPETTLGN